MNCQHTLHRNIHVEKFNHLLLLIFLTFCKHRTLLITVSLNETLRWSSVFLTLPDSLLFFISVCRRYQSVCWESSDWNRARADTFLFICSLACSHFRAQMGARSVCHARCPNTSHKYWTNCSWLHLANDKYHIFCTLGFSVQICCKFVGLCKRVKTPAHVANLQNSLILALCCTCRIYFSFFWLWSLAITFY